MIVYISGDSIIDAQNNVLASGFFIFKEAVRHCSRQGWKWYYLHGKQPLQGCELWRKLGHTLSPRLPERYMFNRALQAELYDILVKKSTSYVPRPYLKTREILSALHRRGDGEFFGVWFVYHETGIYYASGNSRVQLAWEPAGQDVLIEQAN